MSSKNLYGKCGSSSEHKEVASDLVLWKKHQNDENGSFFTYHSDLERVNVQKMLQLFRQTYKAISSEFVGTPRVDSRAVTYMKEKGMSINIEKRFGHIPGIAIGDKFLYRAELQLVGMHNQPVSGIDYLYLDGRKFAVSIVDAGRYENMSRKPGVLIYTGHGGQLSKSKLEDQKLLGGNQAMVNSYKEGYPIRVIKNCKNSDMTFSKKDTAFVYDGLYTIQRYWQERATNDKLVFKFELYKISGQESISLPMRANVKCKGRCVVNDISEGEETVAIHAINGIDGEIPPSFTYLNSVAYPEWSKKHQYGGCTCITGCSNSDSTIGCPCIPKRKVAYVLECGPNCKCPRSCQNRVSQQGPRYKLEIFKKGAGLWGVRSRSYISAGSFVCEFVGKLQRSRTGETSDQPGKCKYDYMIDASKFGNVGRFINRDISPNLSIRNVFYNMTVPHLGLYAAKNILPNQELTLPMDDIGEFKCRIMV